MANAKFQDVNAALYQILLTLVGDGLPLQAAADNPNEVMDKGYPIGFPEVDLETPSEEYVFTDNENIIGMNFKLVFLMRNEGTKETYDNLLALCDQMLAEFRKEEHATLGGLVHKFYIKGAITFFVTGEAQTELVGFKISTVAESLMLTQ